jgi:Kef-type K+ transport system membrane component KefB
MQSADVTVMLLALAVLLGTARLLAEVAQWLRQPAVVGEILAGVLLGPTVFGAIAPQWQSFLFPQQGPNATVLEGIGSLAIVLFLLVAGLEVDLSTVWKQGPAALKVAVAGMLVPFGWGLLCAVVMPRALGRPADADPLIFALFVATALAITALPVIAKTLMDLNLYRTGLGMIVISAAILNDLAGWTVFAVILGMIDAGDQGLAVPWTITLTLLFTGLMLTVGRPLVHRLLPYVHAYTQWPGGVLGFATALALAGAAFTQWIGIHAIFGSFIVGVAIGDSSHLREHSRVVVAQFVSYIFAPVFFASIGLKVNFWTHFDLWLTLLVLAVACIGKLAGAALGARWARLPTRDRWAIGLAMNARGAMEIILGLLALEAGLIGQSLFVALVVMAIVTSVISGPMMRWILAQRVPTRLRTLLSSQRFTRNLQATTPRDAIRELATLVCAVDDRELEPLNAAVWAREEAVSTGIGNGVAVPHARLPGFTETLVAVGLSDAGIDFDAPDGRPAHIVFLIITLEEEPEVELDLLSEIARAFSDAGVKERALRAGNYTEFIGALRTI